MRMPTANRHRPFLVLAIALAAVSLGLANDGRNASRAEGSDWTTGDVFLAISNGSYQVYNSAGGFKETISDGLGGYTTGCAFDSVRDFYATNYSHTKVIKYDDAHPHPVLQTISAGAASLWGFSKSIVFAANGDFYVGHAFGNGDILRYSAAGILQQTYDVAREAGGSDWIDLALDQKTIFYASRGGLILRYDMANDVQLPDFANIGGVSRGLRLLPPGDGSGGLLVAHSSDVKRVDGSGNVVQTYDAPGEASWASLALDPNGSSFWAGDSASANFYRFNIATGAIEVGPINTGPGSTLFGLCVLGGFTAAIPRDLNDAPTCNDLNITIAEDTPVVVDLDCADPDVGDTLTYTIVSLPSNGALSGTAPNLTYAPDLNHNGDDSVVYKANDGTADSNIATVTITVNPVNDAPVVVAGADQSASEGAVVTFSGSFDDPDAGDTHTIEWDFGDGTSAPAGTLTPTHVYADDGSYTVTLTVTDGGGASGNDSATVTVQNVAPTVDAGPDQTVDEGSVVMLSPAIFNDKGTLDTHTATIDWDDASPVEAGIVAESPFGPPGSTAGADGTISGSHVYADDGMYTVEVCVTDDDGAITCDTTGVQVDNVAPTVDAGPDQTVNEGDTVDLAPATFNDKGTLDTHTATIDWGDGTAVEPGAVAEAPFGPPGSTTGTDGTTSGSHVYADDGMYTVEVCVTDDDGAITCDTVAVEVDTVAPTVDAGPDETVDEGSVVMLSPASFNDKGTLDTHTATIDWGDGSPLEDGAVSESPFGPPGSEAGADGTVSGSHVYADDEMYTVEVCVTDDDGAITCDTFVVTVENVAPWAVAGPDETIDEGSVMMLSPATFHDQGTLDTHTAAIDWGDGSPVEAGVVAESPFGPPGSEAGADGTVSGSHVYADDGVFTMTVTVIDDGGSSGSDTCIVTVENVPPLAEDQSVTTDEDTPVAINLTASDPGDDSLAFTIVGGPSSGTLSGSLPNLTYTPNPDWNGTDSLSYKANDGTADSNIASVTITVNPVNDAPVVSADPVSQTVQYSDGIATVTITASDIDSSSLSILADLPGGLTLGDGSCTTGNGGVTCTWTLNGQALVGAGTYCITTTV
ncbi:MAG: tandem-95 repeat protein, partial [Gemmatimonadales bacterium]|nr:tandem-95 repeat protein [Gemmatimonadales bacterium]